MTLLRFIKTGVLVGFVGYGSSASARYLQPEPMLNNPRFVQAMARRGMSTPTYAYAANNPLAFTDPDGRTIRWVDRVLQPYLDAMRQTPTGSSLLSAMERSRTPFSFKAGWAGFSNLGPRRGVTNRAPMCSNSAPVDIVVNVDTARSRNDPEWNLLNTVGHEATHGDQMSHSPDGFPAWLEGAAESAATYNGADIAGDYFQ
jgi:hypothetical protein